MPDDEMTPEEEEAAIDAAREWNARREHLHDIFSPYYNRGRQRDVALEKWGPKIEEMMERDLTRMGNKQETREFRRIGGFPDPPKKDGPDMDRE